MADTGAPWNLPYPLATDLVRDGAQAIEDLAEAVADGLDDLDTAIANIPVLAGIGSNVVQTVVTATATRSTNTWGTIGGMSVTITPTSATAKVLVIAEFVYGFAANANDQAGFFRISGGNATDYVGDAAGNRTRAAASFGIHTASHQTQPFIYTSSIIYLDSPATTSATTYNLESISPQSRTIYLNRGETNTDASFVGRFASSITAIEVQA